MARITCLIGGVVMAILAGVCFGVEVFAAILFDSYSDSTCSIQSDLFDSSGAVVYMKAEGLTKSKPYHVKYFDGAGIELASMGVSSDSNGVLASQIKPKDYPASQSGTWRAELWSDQPVKLIATDTFEVTAQAIPEFPTVLTGIVVPLISSGIYFIRRRNAIKMSNFCPRL